MVVRCSLAVVAALLLAGCTGADDEQPATSTESCCDDDNGLGGTRRGVDGIRHLDLADHRDRVAHRRPRRGPRGVRPLVFEFRNGIPGYEVGYAGRPILADGSGEEVAVSGGAVLVVRMEPALDADLTQEAAPRTYTGPVRFAPDAAAVAEVARVGGFEAVLTWAAGVDEKRAFRVTRLDDPARIVIDIDTG